MAEVIQAWRSNTSSSADGVKYIEGPATTPGSTLVVCFAVRNNTLNHAGLSDISGNQWVEIGRWVEPLHSTAQVVWAAFDADSTTAAATGFYDASGNPIETPQLGILVEISGVTGLRGAPKIWEGTQSTPTVTQSHEAQVGDVALASLAVGVSNRSWTPRLPYQKVDETLSSQTTIHASAATLTASGPVGPVWDRGGSGANPSIISFVLAGEGAKEPEPAPQAYLGATPVVGLRLGSTPVTLGR